MPVFAGDIVNGKYRVEHVLGEGGMGIVVAARHIDLQELYAIKIMKPGALGCDAYAEHRFLGEARAAARLKGEHVARVHDIERLDSGELYMVMEYLRGTDLHSLIRKRGPLPVQEALTYVLQTCEALAEAHALNIVHRDIKPHNLFLIEGSKSIKVLDFGISKQRTSEGRGFTESNVLLGTLSYMSPEQMRQSKYVDARSDVWSIGVVLYELVTGVVPFPGQGIVDVFARVSNESLTPPSRLRPELPAALDAIVERCLQKHPAKRFESVDELARALRSLRATVNAELAQRLAMIAAAPPRVPHRALSPAASPVDQRVHASPIARHGGERQPVAAPLPPASATDSPPITEMDNASERQTEPRHRRVRRVWRWKPAAGAFAIMLFLLAVYGQWSGSAPPKRLSSAAREPAHDSKPSPDTPTARDAGPVLEPCLDARECERARRVNLDAAAHPAADVHPDGRDIPPKSLHQEPYRPQRQPKPPLPHPHPVAAPQTGPAGSGSSQSSTDDAATRGADIRCKLINGNKFPVSMDVSNRSQAEISSLISEEICREDVGKTQLCCTRSHY